MKRVLMFILVFILGCLLGGVIFLPLFVVMIYKLSPWWMLFEVITFPIGVFLDKKIEKIVRRYENY